MTNTLKISMLGRFEISFGSKTIDGTSNRSKKVWLLLEYLIYNRHKHISQTDLFELLWPDNNIKNPKNTLKALLFRARKLLEDIGVENAKDILTYHRDSYIWNSSIEVEVDTDTFENYLNRATTSDDERLNNIQRAVELYIGDFLPKSSLESWVIPINRYYHSLYVSAVLEAVELLSKKQAHREILQLCQKAVAIAETNELLHQRLISAHINLGQYDEAINYYKNICNVLFSQIGVTPSPELISSYNEAVTRAQNEELNLEIVKKQLSLDEDENGCFYCEYAFFKYICNMIIRDSYRTNTQAHMCLFTIKSLNNNKLSPKQCASYMNKLKAIISTSLRKGDIFTQYSISQFLVILPYANYDNSINVAQRILSSFNTRHYKVSRNLNILYSVVCLNSESDSFD